MEYKLHIVRVVIIISSNNYNIVMIFNRQYKNILQKVYKNKLIKNNKKVTDKIFDRRKYLSNIYWKK